MKFNKTYYEEYKDQFNYYNIIKKINPSFRLYFNKKLRRFEIINIFNNFEICYSFISFFRNIESDLRFSKIENLNLILKNIDINNNQIDKKNNIKNYEKNKFCFNEYLSLTNRSTSIKPDDLNKIIGATKC